ncbi:unnamed protein product [Debaryomyces tyrocola]|nr:unnamed protein product [Debaryomyces tyrocola]
MNMASSEMGVNLSNVTSDSYYGYADMSSFTIPSSPIRSISHKRKRSQDLDLITHITINGHALGDQAIDEHAKRCQQHKIHSELHQNTIDMMMKSQKILQEQERLHKLYNEDNPMHEDIVNDETKDNYKQRPFWPIINKTNV